MTAGEFGEFCLFISPYQNQKFRSTNIRHGLNVVFDCSNVSMLG